MRWMKAIVITLLVIVCGMATGKVEAAGEACCYSSDCPCFSSDGSCTATCADASAFCGTGTPEIVDGTCAQTYTNPTELCFSGWDDWSACENGYKTRLCRNPWQLQVNTCVGGGGTAECTGRTDNCPINWTPAPNMPLAGVNPNPYCRRGTYCPPPGNAQILTGCCQSDPTDPTNPCIVGEYKTVQCCPPGTAEGYVDTVSTDYTYTHSCHDPGNTGLGGVCQNPTDIWKSDGRDTSSLCYVAVNNCSYDKDDNPYDCEYTNIYNFSTTCTRVTRTYSCVSTCDTTAPSGVLVTNEPTVGTSVTINWQKGANGVSRLFLPQHKIIDQPCLP